MIDYSPALEMRSGGVKLVPEPKPLLVCKAVMPVFPHSHMPHTDAHTVLP